MAVIFEGAAVLVALWLVLSAAVTTANTAAAAAAVAMAILLMEPSPVAEAQHIVRGTATAADVRALLPNLTPGEAAGPVVGVKVEGRLRRPQGGATAAYATGQTAHSGSAVGEAFQEEVRAQNALWEGRFQLPVLL